MTTNNPLPLTETLSLYNDTVCRTTGQYFCNTNPFSTPRTGNKVKMLACGRDVFKEIYDAMMGATSFICIADWQMAHDVELVSRGTKDYPGRLHNIIRSIISKKAVHVRVLLYLSPSDSAVGTYDGMVARFLNGLNAKGYPGTVHVLLQPATSGQNDSYEYSHHQKFVVVDGHIGFLGGIDLSYGRWETPEFDVVVDPQNAKLNEMYSPCQVKLRPPSSSEKKIIEQYDFAEPYGGKLIDEGCQPRMPWQDVHIRVEGPSVVDVYRNFARRWASRLAQLEGRQMPNVVGWGMNKDWLEKIGAWNKLSAAQAIVPGGAQVQIVRSVSNRHLRMEGESPQDLQLYPNIAERAVWQKCLKTWSNTHQSNILNAMVNCIRNADNYIYIESQFFISQFGFAGGYSSREVGNENDGVQNTIVTALAERIGQHIRAQTPFHVYLVFPTHPEGLMSNEACWKQHWLAISTIKHGSASLIERIQRALKLKKRPESEWNQYLTVLNMRNYGATVLYARDPDTFTENFDHEIGRYVVTEQIYIHSKLMIVDDAVAIIGSANINDRSLTGNGDTEIAAVVVDTEGVELRDLGSPTVKVQTRKFARELRQQLWKKHFGFLVDSSAEKSNYFNSTQRAARLGKKIPENLPFPPRLKLDEQKFKSLTGFDWLEILEKPCARSTIAAIQSIAKNNSSIYEEVFIHTPRNSMSTFDDISKLHFSTLPYPVTYNKKGNKELSSHGSTGPVGILDRKNVNEYGGAIPPALNKKFMTKKLFAHQESALKEKIYYKRQQLYADGSIHDVSSTISHLKTNVVGFFVMAPLDWGRGTLMDGDPTGATGAGVDIASTNGSATGGFNT